MISAPGEPPGSRVTMARSFAARKTLGELLDLRGLSGALAAFKRDELPASGGPLQRCLVHAQSFSALARNMPMTSSLAPSIARRMVEPVPTASAA